MEDCYEVPIVERLRSVTKDYRTCVVTQWAEDGSETGHRFIPVGYLMHEAADEIVRLQVLVSKIGGENNMANRFIDNGDGTVTDNLTKLIWLKNANAFGVRTWEQALSDANTLASGSAGLTDGSKAGDWRLPNGNELLSLIDVAYFNPALPNGHPFIGVQSSNYWSRTNNSYGTTMYAWYVYMESGKVGCGYKGYTTYYVWPVRSC